VANDLINAAQARANANTAAANIAYQGVNAATAGVNAAAQRAALGAQGLDNAVNFNAANLANANALGNFDNMTLGQLYQLLNLGQAGIGKTDTGTSSSITNSSGTTTTKSTPSAWDIFRSAVSMIPK
jgi:hypothetical protein